MAAGSSPSPLTTSNITARTPNVLPGSQPTHQGTCATCKRRRQLHEVLRRRLAAAISSGDAQHAGHALAPCPAALFAAGNWRRTQRGLASLLSSGMPGDNDTALQGTRVQPVRVRTLAYARDYGPKRRAAGAFHRFLSARVLKNLDRAK